MDPCIQSSVENINGVCVPRGIYRMSFVICRNIHNSILANKIPFSKIVPYISTYRRYQFTRHTHEPVRDLFVLSSTCYEKDLGSKIAIMLRLRL